MVKSISHADSSMMKSVLVAAAVCIFFQLDQSVRVDARRSHSAWGVTAPTMAPSIPPSDPPSADSSSDRKKRKTIKKRRKPKNDVASDDEDERQTIAKERKKGSVKKSTKATPSMHKKKRKKKHKKKVNPKRNPTGASSSRKNLPKDKESAKAEVRKRKKSWPPPSADSYLDSNSLDVLSSTPKTDPVKKKNSKKTIKKKAVKTRKDRSALADGSRPGHSNKSQKIHPKTKKAKKKKHKVKKKTMAVSGADIKGEDREPPVRKAPLEKTSSRTVKKKKRKLKVKSSAKGTKSPNDMTEDDSYDDASSMEVSESQTKVEGKPVESPDTQDVTSVETSFDGSTDRSIADQGLLKGDEDVSFGVNQDTSENVTENMPNEKLNGNADVPKVAIEQESLDKSEQTPEIQEEQEVSQEISSGLKLAEAESNQNVLKVSTPAETETTQVEGSPTLVDDANDESSDDDVDDSISGDKSHEQLHSVNQDLGNDKSEIEGIEADNGTPNANTLHTNTNEQILAEIETQKDSVSENMADLDNVVMNEDEDPAAQESSDGQEENPIREEPVVASSYHEQERSIQEQAIHYSGPVAECIENDPFAIENGATNDVSKSTLATEIDSDDRSILEPSEIESVSSIAEQVPTISANDDNDGVEAPKGAIPITGQNSFEEITVENIPDEEITPVSDKVQHDVFPERSETLPVDKEEPSFSQLNSGTASPDAVEATGSIVYETAANFKPEAAASPNDDTIESDSQETEPDGENDLSEDGSVAESSTTVSNSTPVSDNDTREGEGAAGSNTLSDNIVPAGTSDHSPLVDDENSDDESKPTVESVQLDDVQSLHTAGSRVRSDGVPTEDATPDLSNKFGVSDLPKQAVSAPEKSDNAIEKTPSYSEDDENSPNVDDLGDDVDDNDTDDEEDSTDNEDKQENVEKEHDGEKGVVKGDKKVDGVEVDGEEEGDKKVDGVEVDGKVDAEEGDEKVDGEEEIDEKVDGEEEDFDKSVEREENNEQGLGEDDDDEKVTEKEEDNVKGVGKGDDEDKGDGSDKKGGDGKEDDGESDDDDESDDEKGETDSSAVNNLKSATKVSKKEENAVPSVRGGLEQTESSTNENVKEPSVELGSTDDITDQMDKAAPMVAKVPQKSRAKDIVPKKNRFAFIRDSAGIANHIDTRSLVSSEDDDNDINVSVVTWNLAEESPSEDDAAFIRKFRKSGVASGTGSDLVLISAQECENIKPRRSEGHRSREYRRLMIKMLGKQYVPIALHLLGGIQFGLFARRAYLKEIEFVAVADVTCGIGNVFHNKGAIAAFIKVKARPHSQKNDSGAGKSPKRDKSLRMMFVTAHLAAHVKNSDARDSDFWRISSELEAQAPEQFLPPRTDSSFIPEHSSYLFDSMDRVFFCGDLNYRLSLPRELAENVVLQASDDKQRSSDTAEQFLESSWLELLRHDQLRRTIAEQTAFPGFSEGRIAFAPTFKFDKGSNEYDTSHKQRIPAWTDRILFKPTGTRVLEYTSVPEAQHSDHRPVHGTFRVSMLGRELPSRKKRSEQVE